jgi:hypothetical protein
MATKKKISKNKPKKMKLIFGIILKPFFAIKKRISDFLNRRPHRSFRMTRRRDYIRGLRLPGYIKFTNYVLKTLWSNKKILLLLALVYAVLSILLIGLGSQDTYSALSETMSTIGENFNGFWGEIGKAGLLSLSVASGNLNGSLTESQQIFSYIIVLMAWLTTVWLLRNILAGNKIKLRDGIYSSGSPILPTFLVSLILIIQLLPIALVAVGYSAAAVTGLLDGGVEAMLFWFAAALLIVVSLYFITSTVFALIIITLPGMYPFKAIKIAGDLVLGRRFKILMRFLWMILVTAIIWALIMIPMVIFDGWLKNTWPQIIWLPVVPIVLLVLSSITIIWVSSYIYLLYRRIVADESSQA